MSGNNKRITTYNESDSSNSQRPISSLGVKTVKRGQYSESAKPYETRESDKQK